MVLSPVFKTQIVLSDYAFRKDIEHRLFLSNLSSFEVEVLREILHQSLIIPIEKLAADLEVKKEKLIPVLDHLKQSKLFKLSDTHLTVDKELRKYYESQLEKFEDDFEPNFEFLQGLLNKVPLPVLVGWYTLPRSSTNIFNSLIEQVFSSPDTYRQYLSELNFKDKILHKIIQDLNQSPDHQVCAKHLLAKYELTREKFEEYLLLLEFHFVCCLRYIRNGDIWEEVVTFFAEWKTYLEFEEKANPPIVKNQKAVIPNCPVEFCFIEDITNRLKSFMLKKGTKQEEPLHLDREEWKDILDHKLQQLMFLENEDDRLLPTEKGLLWLKKSLHEKILALSLDPLYKLTSVEVDELWSPRNLRLIGKALKPLTHHKWVYLEDFLAGFNAPIGTKSPIALKKKGTRWKYVLPEFTDTELDFVRSTIMERFFELGIVMTGKHEDRPCFYLTHFGHQFIN